MPKPYFGDWNGSGCHANFSTKSMREEGGYEVIMNAIKNLEAAHQNHIACYGAGNKDRLTGKHETASWKQFSYGVGNRGASIRSPVQTDIEKKGYLEDRRPSSAMNPYVVCGMLTQTSLGICPEIEFPSDL
jgi:glutamine synthetase